MSSGKSSAKQCVAGYGGAEPVPTRRCCRLGFIPGPPVHGAPLSEPFEGEAGSVAPRLGCVP